MAALDVTSEKGKEQITLENAAPNKPVRQIMLWTAPAPGIAKINSDAGFDLDSGQGWAGVVVRDHRGYVFLSAGCLLPI